MLGISVYPEKATQTEILNYITTASKYNYKRLFTCLLSVNKPKDVILNEFQTIISHARSYNMEVILDVSPRVFDDLNISYNDLSFFAQTGATGIRLDASFNGQIEAALTHNPYDLDIEINMSQDTHYLETILDYKPNVDKLIGCHNFYPQEYCGLSYEYFKSCSLRFKQHNIRSAAFITSNTAIDGPWPISDGICTIEMHRNLDSSTQLKHLYACGLIDDIIIGNQFASEEELASLAAINPNILTFKLTDLTATDLEMQIIFDEQHFNRGDVNDYLIRSTQSRVKYKQHPNPPHDIQQYNNKGYIVIGNDNFGQYKNELQVIKNQIRDDKRRNVVARIIDEEIFLLDLLKPWQFFRFENDL